MARETKADKIKRHLITYGCITSWQAIQLYRVTRLSAVIFNLKKEGWLIKSERQSNEDSSWALYTCIDFPAQLELNLGV